MAQASARELVRGIANVPRGERLLTLLMFVWFFITLASYYVIRPVRSAFVLEDFGPTVLPWVYMGTAVVTGIVVYVYAKLASLPRRLLIGGALLLFASNLFAWWWIARQAEAARAAGLDTWNWASPVFYVWTDVFSIMAVTIFWMYANDVYPPRSAKRIFGIIGAAGPLGGLTGARLTASLVGTPEDPGLGAVNMVLVAAGIYVLAFVIFVLLEMLTRGRSAERGAAAAKFEKANLSELPAVLRLIASSRFLLFLTFVVCFERMVPDFADYIWQTTASAAFPDPDAYSEFFATVEFWRNVIAFLATLFFTAAILNLLGVRFALASVPLTIALLSGAFALVGGLGLVIALKHGEEGQRHTWFKAGKETTYTATSRDVIYRVKGYIEMFFYRLSRGIAGILLLLLVHESLLGLGVREVAIAAVPLALLWLWCAWNLGKEYEALEREVERTGGETPATAPARA
jgi:AAA family ATP:ADP antiporter